MDRLTRLISTHAPLMKRICAPPREEHWGIGASLPSTREVSIYRCCWPCIRKPCILKILATRSLPMPSGYNYSVTRPCPTCSIHCSPPDLAPRGTHPHHTSTPRRARTTPLPHSSTNGMTDGTPPFPDVRAARVCADGRIGLTAAGRRARRGRVGAAGASRARASVAAPPPSRGDAAHIAYNTLHHIALHYLTPQP